jgi:hypothetical protein
MGEYYRCDNCTGLKVKTEDGWIEFDVKETCKHDFVYSKIERTGYIEPVIKRRGRK